MELTTNEKKLFDLIKKIKKENVSLMDILEKNISNIPTGTLKGLKKRTGKNRVY